LLFGKNINKYYLKYLAYIIVGIIALIFVDVYQLKMPEIIGGLVSNIKDKTLTLDLINSYIKEMIIIVTIMFLGRFTWRICIFGNGVRVQTDLRSELFKKAELLSQVYYQENKVGSIMALYTNDLFTIRQVFGSGMIMLIDALFLGVIALYKMFVRNLTLTIIAIIPLACLAVASVFVGRFMKKKFEKRQEAFANLSDFAQESFSGLSVIKAFLKETQELKRFAKINKDNMDKNIDFIRTQMLLERLLFGFLIGSVFVILYGVGGYIIYQGKEQGFDIGTLTEFISYFDTLIWPMMAIASLINLSSQARASMDRIDKVLNHEVEIKDGKDIINDHKITGEITFNNLSFTYPNTEREVLSNISLTIPKGTSIGLIGKTGCGKSTLVNLLLRIYNIEENSLLLDGKDIMKLPIKQVREAISYVPQDNFLFSDTIANNIGFSKAEIDINDVRRASIASDVDENILEFTEQYETVLGERGVTVSGGQKQRISIARALMKNSQVLILDDSVSAVDTKTEETIIANLKKLREGKTTILIAHRITTVKKLDRIIVMDDGKIVGYGTHEELEQTCPLYKNMVFLQRLEDDMGEDNE
jgi:ATP-binding cassette subfamily B protein